jgi:hypothetical protein
MRPGNRVLLFGSAMVAGAIVACSSSGRPPDAVFESRVDAAPESGTIKRVSGTAPGQRHCIDTSFHEMPTDCSCTYGYGNGISFGFPCGVTFCSQGKGEAAICRLNGELVVVPISSLAECADAGADLPDLPPCNATDAATAADAAAD